MNGIFLLLGSNIGDKHQHLQTACQLLESSGIKIQRSSSIFETAPWGKEDQEWFLNAAIEIETDLGTLELLESVLSIELKMGRKRVEKWGSRIIDIDILYYKNEKINSSSLKIPHPGIPNRKFTLVLLDELIPNELHPISNLTQKEMLALCVDLSTCNKTNLKLK